MSNKRFPGGIMATCCIPWDESGCFAERIFRQNVQHSLQETKLLYIFGTAGEGYAVTDRQYEEIVTAFADEMRGGKAEPMVGVIDLSLGTIMERIKRGRDLGALRFQISLPSCSTFSRKPAMSTDRCSESAGFWFRSS